MTGKSGARWKLRSATATDHDAVDTAFGGFDLGDRRKYKVFLTAQAAAFLPVEAGLDRVDFGRVLPDWTERRRSAALIADLAELGETTPPAAETLAFDTAEAALGAIYVLEGSRLGGRMLARSVPPDLPRRFLDAGDAALWRTLIEVLDTTLRSEDQLKAAIGAARAVFARFAASARYHREDLRH